MLIVQVNVVVLIDIGVMDGCQTRVKARAARYLVKVALSQKFEGAQTVKCKPGTERVAEKGLPRGVSRAACERRINRELEAKKAHKP